MLCGIFMSWFFLILWRNFIGCFRGRMALWHVVAIVLTALLVGVGWDWQYFAATRGAEFQRWAWLGVRWGSKLPIWLPVVLLVLGYVSRNNEFLRLGAAEAQAVMLGLLISSTYKVFTGRAHPPLHEMGSDISRVFRFGFLRGGAFWGWPSSHTTIAFAMGVTIYMMLPKQRWVGWLAVAYALCVGLGVSVTIHWLSDFVAGAIIGSVIGVVVGKGFYRRGIGVTPNIEHPTSNTEHRIADTEHRIADTER